MVLDEVAQVSSLSTWPNPVGSVRFLSTTSHKPYDKELLKGIPKSVVDENLTLASLLAYGRMMSNLPGILPSGSLPALSDGCHVLRVLGCDAALCIVVVLR